MAFRASLALLLGSLVLLTTCGTDEPQPQGASDASEVVDIEDPAGAHDSRC